MELEKAIDKMLYPFSLHPLNKLGLEENFFNQIKRCHKKLTEYYTK